MSSTRDALAQAPVLDYAKPDARTDRPAWRWARAGLGIAALAAWFAATMTGASPNTSWEHHPFAGPFIILKESGSPGEFAFASSLLACILAPLARWVWAGKWWGALAAVAASAATTWMSYTIAGWASC